MRPALVAALVAAVVVGAPGASPGQPARRAVHGADSVFRADDVVIAWAVRRGAGEADAEVVVRVGTTRFASWSVEAVDPFAGTRRTILPRGPLAGAAEVRRRRADFADLPRLELHLDPPADSASTSPITVYYLGVPDTTPEFTSDEALRRYLDGAVATVGGARAR